MYAQTKKKSSAPCGVHNGGRFVAVWIRDNCGRFSSHCLQVVLRPLNLRAHLCRRIVGQDRVIGGVVSHRYERMSGEISQFEWREGTVRIVHWTQRVGAKLCTHLRLCFRGLETFKPLDHIPNLTSRSAAQVAVAFQHVPPERFAPYHMLRGHKKNRGNAELLKQRQRLGIVVVPIVKGNQNVFCRKVAALAKYRPERQMCRSASESDRGKAGTSRS